MPKLQFIVKIIKTAFSEDKKQISNNRIRSNRQNCNNLFKSYEGNSQKLIWSIIIKKKIFIYAFGMSLLEIVTVVKLLLCIQGWDWISYQKVNNIKNPKQLWQLLMIRLKQSFQSNKIEQFLDLQNFLKKDHQLFN
ncbi:unnamed protein product [Paramecium sonneborni]|uniref:Transmembrane protein n=1 Tax=Paramecium sonneborni TaxID=65129 RepID=A0A8S1MSV8_9CILI|nr:unnamed protein product [Paramecium sonneborni]